MVDTQIPNQQEEPTSPLPENPKSHLKNAGDFLRSRSKFEKISMLVFLIGAIVLTLFVISQQTNFFSHASRSVLGTCMQPPSCLTDGTCPQLNYAKNVNWCTGINSPITSPTPQPNPNPIVVENQNPGDPNWQVTKPASGQTIQANIIQGYSWTTSITAGNSLDFSVRTGDTGYTVDVYRLGWYQGIGARHMYSTTISCQVNSCWQNDPTVDQNSGIDPAYWPKSFTIPTKKTWTTGAYVVKLTTSTTGFQSYIPFTVTTPYNPEIAPVPLIFVNATNTYQAYNLFQSTDLYTGTFADDQGERVGAVEESFDRPYGQNNGSGNLFSWEYNMIRWLEKNGYNITYLTDTDLDASSLSTSHHFYDGVKGIIFVGHDEYCSLNMRANLQAAVNKGVNLAFFGANNCMRQIRFSSGAQPGSTNTNDRILTSYDEPLNLDPLGSKEPGNAALQERLTPYPNKPEQQLIGAMYLAQMADPNQNPTYFNWVVTNPVNWLFVNTTFNAPGSFVTNLIGGETDSNIPNLVQPTTKNNLGVDIIAASPVVDSKNMSYTSQATLYQAPSGAYVFDASTFIWSWFLDNFVPNFTQRKNFPLVSATDQQNVATMTTNLLTTFLTGQTPTINHTQISPATTTSGSLHTGINQSASNNSSTLLKPSQTPLPTFSATPTVGAASAGTIQINK